MSPKPCPSTKNQTLIAKAAVLSSAPVPSSAAMPLSTLLLSALVTPERKADSVQLFWDFNSGYNQLLAIKNAILNKTNSKMLWDLYGQMATSLVSCHCFFT